MSAFCPPDSIRSGFSRAMSAMYQREVPQYGTLTRLVRDVNAEVLAAHPETRARLEGAGELARLDVERHGAIRLGTAQELRQIRRMFNVMGMMPVGYYDLSVAGIPVHSTAFRPVTEAALKHNPFRVFTSLLRLDLLSERALAAEAAAILDKRQIVTDEALTLIERAEDEGGLTEIEAERFIAEAVLTFQWHKRASVGAETYARLHQAHRLIADVVSFPGPHINHLTPRTLDIDAVQARMPTKGIAPKAVIEGPPRRTHDILLRQTSFKALDEPVLFASADGDQPGTHTARFGEIEQRGVALTPKGRALYDRCLATARTASSVAADGGGAADYAQALSDAFEALPDDLDRLRQEGLAFMTYRPGLRTPPPDATSIEALIKAGALIADPQVYEDFLPVSAAGIFQSNLGSDAQSNFGESANQDAFEQALGQEVLDPMALYGERQAKSLTRALKQIGVSISDRQTH